MDKTTCFFCESECEKYENFNTDGNKYICPYCGKYELTRIVTDDSEFKDKLISNKHIFSGYLEETKENRQGYLTITTDKIDGILNDVLIPKTVMQKLEKLLLYCYKRNEYIGQEFTTNPSYIDRIYKKPRVFINRIPKRLGIAYSKDKSELDGLVNGMAEFEWAVANYTPREGLLTCFTLTAKGLAHAEQLLTTNINSTKVFVAMGFKDDYKERLKYAIKPACKDCGFDAFIVSDNEFNNSIIDEMLVGIKTSKFLITDLTYNNCGAYYEAGFAHGLGLEVIKCCSKKWFDEKDENGKPVNRLHFDVIADNLILYGDYEDFKKKLKNRIRATINGAILEDIEK